MSRRGGAVAIAVIGVLFMVLLTIMSITTDVNDDDIVPKDDTTTSIPY